MSYFSPLSDALPEHVVAAMDAASVKAIHRPQPLVEPAVLAGVRELLRHVTLTSEVDEVRRQYNALIRATVEEKDRRISELHEQLQIAERKLAERERG